MAEGLEIVTADAETTVQKMTREEAEWSTLEDLLGNGYHRRRVIADITRLTTAMACVDVIEQDLSKAQLRMYRKQADGGRVEVRPQEHPVALLLAKRPNDDQNWRMFWALVFRWLAIHEEMFIVKQITRRGDLRALLPAVPVNVSEHILERTGERWWDVTRNSPRERRMFRRFDQRIPEEFVIHLVGRSMDGFRGLSTLTTGESAFALAQRINNYQQRLYERDARMRGVFQAPKDAQFNDTNFRRLRHQLRELWNRMTEEDFPLVLEGGTEFKPISSNARDSEVAKVAQDAISDVARAFRVPQHKIGHLQAVKYENLEIQERTYVHDCLIPRAKVVESELPFHFLTDDELGDYEFEFDREQMVATDPKTRADIAQKLLQVGAISFDEARAEVGYDPLPKGLGKRRLVPVNMAQIDESGEVVVQGANPAADEGGEADENDASNVIPMPARS